MAHPLILPLPRPEYPSAPELLLSSLAWRAYRLSGLDDHDGKPVALAYRRDTQRQSRTLAFRATEPAGEQIVDWEASLRSAGIDWPDEAARVVGPCVAESIAGIRAAKAKGQAAIPMTPHLAMLQNARGLTGKRNPANYGQIIEQLHALGGNHGASASSKWLSATRMRLESDPLLAAIDKAAADLLPAPIAQRDPEAVAAPLSMSGDTPFGWFVDAWDKLTSPAWVEALPARRWSDWATAAIRLAVGMGFLWEASWYESLARLIVGPEAEIEALRDDGEPWERLVRGRLRELLPWQSDAESVSVRDVAPVVKERIRRGGAARTVLANRLPDTPSADYWDDVLGLARDEDAKSELQWAMSPRSGHSPNTTEAVRYVLMTREESGSHADHYGMLVGRANNRYLLVQPATELLAMLASLAASGPLASGNGATSLGAISDQLRRLGLQPSLGTLVAHLERTGLTRGSADADQAVVVSAAY